MWGYRENTAIYKPRRGAPGETEAAHAWISDSRFLRLWEINFHCGSRPACTICHGCPEVTYLVRVCPHPQLNYPANVRVFIILTRWASGRLTGSVRCICRGVSIWTHSVTEVWLPSPSCGMRRAQRSHEVRPTREDEQETRGGSRAPGAPRGETVSGSKVCPLQTLWHGKTGIRLVDQNSEDAKKIELDLWTNVVISLCFSETKTLGSGMLVFHPWDGFCFRNQICLCLQSIFYTHNQQMKISVLVSSSLLI